MQIPGSKFIVAGVITGVYNGLLKSRAPPYRSLFPFLFLSQSQSPCHSIRCHSPRMFAWSLF